MHRKLSNSNLLICNMDVTAFCAILFVIAMIMMFVTSKPFDDGWPVDLPRVNHTSILRWAGRDDALVITVEHDSSVFFAVIASIQMNCLQESAMGWLMAVNEKSISGRMHERDLAQSKMS